MRHLFPLVSPSRMRGWFAAVAALCFALSGCGSGFIAGYPSAITSPVATLRVSQSTTLGTHVVLTQSPMKFFVNGIEGGNSVLGTVDSKGVYTAPAIVPSPSNVVTITAIATLFPNDPPGSVKISVLNPVPVINSITPSSFPEGTATITVQGSQFIYGAQIYWNGVAVPTTYVSSTQLAASVTAPTPGTYSLTVSNPDPGASNSVTVSELVGPGQVKLTLLTGAGSSVRVGNILNVGLTVTGTQNTGVTWLVNGVPGGNAQVGTATPKSDGSVNYTAPLVVPVPSNIVVLTAVSSDNPNVSISQNIAVLNPIPVLTSASPLSFNPGTSTVTVGGSNFITGAQVLVNGAAVPTVFNSGGQLTATLNLTDPGAFDLQVLNPSPGPATSADLVATVTGTPPSLLVSAEDASRFLSQATFGATDADIHHLSKIGYTAWLNEQFNTPATPHAADVEQKLLLNNLPCAANDAICNSNVFLANSTQGQYLYQSFWQQALTGNDQLRQRMKYALSEIMVVSSTNPAVANMPRGMANYYDMLGVDGFGNFRTLLEDVTLSPVMGKFLSMLGNDKGNATRDPDENYAREVMQLFSIGLYQLNPDGTQMLDAKGQTIPTYNNDDVMGLAKVLTGFSWNVPGNQNDAWYNCCLYSGPGYGEDLLPMQPFPSHHSTDAKTFLGKTIPASGVADPVNDLKIALDTIFNHPNVPPFISKQLIQRLVTSNPSPAYVGRVSAVFRDNGQGVRGDMKAVLQAILLDTEARDTYTGTHNPQFGKVREALIRYTHWARAFTAQSKNGSFNTGTTEDPIFGLGQMALRSPSVFNWFAPGYVPPSTSIEKAGLVAPEMQMTDVSTVVGFLNYMQASIGADNNTGYIDVISNYAAELNLATTPDQLVDRMNLLLMAGEMDGTTRSQILAAVNSIAIPTGSNQLAIQSAMANRVKVAIYLTMATPAYNAQF